MISTLNGVTLIMTLLITDLLSPLGLQVRSIHVYPLGKGFWSLWDQGWLRILRVSESRALDASDLGLLSLVSGFLTLRWSARVDFGTA